MKKIFASALVATLAVICSVPALADTTNNNDKGTASWATRNEGVLTTGSYENNYKGLRDKLDNSLGAPDAANNVDGKFTSIAYFPKGVTYTFDKKKSDGTYEKSTIVNNPDGTKPDLSLREITWDGDACSWIGEGVQVYAVNYNGTGKEELIAYAYNKMAQKNIEAYNKKNNKNETLPQVKGAKVEFEFGETQYKNVYVADVYFPDEFKYCDAIKVVDITDTIKKYGGGGQDSKDGYDLDAIQAYNVCYNYSPKKEEETKPVATKTPTLDNKKQDETKKDEAKVDNLNITKKESQTKTEGEGDGYDNSPKTGDTMNMNLGVALMISAAAVMFVTVIMKRRRKY